LITYIASITLSVAQRHRVQRALVFVIIGALTLAVHSWVGKTPAEMKGRQEDNFKALQKDLLETIQAEVTATKLTVDAISTKLQTVAMGSMDHILVDIEHSRNPYELTAFRKGSPDEWQHFSQWIADDPSTKAAIPCLYLYVNSGHYYRIPLLLAYILTDATTSEDIEPIIQCGPQRWEAFPHAGDFFEDHGHLLTKLVESGDQRIGNAFSSFRKHIILSAETKTIVSQ
jgi:hypothetical protein